MQTFRKYSHKDWDAPVILRKSDNEIAVLADLIGEDFTEEGLKVRDICLTEEEFENLPEWDG
jgi:hypothetical protein